MVTDDRCKFCALVRNGATDSWVFEDEAHVVFLDHRPLFPGHCLVIPREHRETLLDVPQPALGALFERVQRVARAVQAAMEADGTFVAMNNTVSQSVPHLHVHLVPRRQKDGLRGFFWPRQSYRDDAHKVEVAASIRAALATLESP